MAESGKGGSDRGRQRSPSREHSRGRGREGNGRDARDERSRSRGRDSGRDRDRSRGGGRDRGEIQTEVMKLQPGAVAYLLGRNGATKSRLANFSGCRLEIDPRGDDGGRVEIIGTDAERRLAQLCIEITLQQRNNGRITIDLDSLEKRDDVTILDVAEDAVGFLLGSKGATLREFETKYRVFMFFDNDHVRNRKKRLYILGTDEARKKALSECEKAVEYKLSGNGSLSSWRERDMGPRYDSSPDRGGRGGYNDRDRYDRDRRSRDRRSRSPPRYRERSRSPRRSYDRR